MVSGGVDSAIALYHLKKKKNYKVFGVFVRSWDSLLNQDIGTECSWKEDYQDARYIAAYLNIKLIKVDLVNEYWDSVFLPFLQNCRSGRITNPDAACNRQIKFGFLLRYLQDRFKIDYLATGHYARLEKKNSHCFLKKAKDKKKDQTYFLYQLDNKQLNSVLFPNGRWKKDDVISLACDIGLNRIAQRRSSRGICFVGERDFKSFIQNYIESSSGKIIDINTNKQLGWHDGVYFYTIGQRKGLKLSGQLQPYYVSGKDVKKNILFVSDQPKKDLFNKEWRVAELNWIGSQSLPIDELVAGKEFFCGARFRYQQEEEDVFIKLRLNDATVKVLGKVKAITPGQAVVFYEGDYCLGGGIIEGEL